MTPGEGPVAPANGPGDPLAPVRAALAGRYEIGAPVGRGGMATVYRTLDVRHNRTVALKVLHPELAVALGAERFLREIQIEARLNHPHILALIDSGQTGHFLYYLAPWADGGTLRERLDREPQLSLEDSLKVVSQIGDGLAHAHRNGVIHRDVKPENILFSSGHALLADFGIAHAIADTGTDALTESGLAVGTPTYMSPEQAMPGGRVDERSDQYALACILFEMLAGEPPFTGRSTRTVLARHMTERPPSLTVVRPDLPAHVVATINRALEKTPAARFPSIDRFLAVLQQQATPSHVAAVPASRRRLAVAAALVGATALAILLWPQRPVLLSANKVAVFPLAISGMESAGSGVNIGMGVAYLIEAALERADPLQLVDAAGRLTAEQLADPLTIRDRDARDIASGLGTAYALRGVVQRHSDSNTVILRLFDVNGDSLIRQASASGSSAATPLHHLGIDALKSLLPALIDPDRPIDFASLRDRRAQSIALWMQGERYYRLSQFDSASQFYERALADDSAFALAAVKGAQAASWIHDQSRAIQLVGRALALESGLPRKYALLARGLSAQFMGDADSAVSAVRAAQAVDPEWAEPAAALGEIYIHLFPSARPLDSLARAALSAAVARDSGFAPPMFHLAEDAIRDGRLGDADPLIERLRRAGAEPRLRRILHLMRECVAGSAASWRVSSPPDAMGMFEAAKSLSPGARQAACAEEGFRAILRSPYSAENERYGAFLGLQGLLVARGADAEARAMVDSIVAAGRGPVRTAFGFHVIRLDRVRGPERQASHILIRPTITEEDHERTRARVEELVTQLRAGVSIDSLRRAHGDAEEAERVGPVARDSMPEDYREALAAAGQGDIVGPFFVLQNGTVPAFAIVRVTRVEAEREATVEDYRKAIVEQYLGPQKLRDELLAELRRSTYIEIRVGRSRPDR